MHAKTHWDFARGAGENYSADFGLDINIAILLYLRSNSQYEKHILHFVP